ncbi:MAG: PKD domain-containing protein, partial [Calditrichaeota bacterium]|nr:PKD domain-containing protein [Calditrichota bacterium]
MRYLKLSCFFAAIFFASVLFSQTIIPDKSEVSGIWSAEGSPYQIQGEAVIPEGQQLIIEPGVRVEFKTGNQHEYVSALFDLGMLRVQGSLQVKGKADSLVVFTRQGDAGNWGLIFFDDTAADSSFLRFCTVQYASHVKYLKNWMDYYGAVSVASAPILLQNVRIGQNADDGVFVKEAPLVLNNCLIHDNGGNGIFAVGQSDLQITNSSIVYNANAGYDCGVNSLPDISNSIFWGNAADFQVGQASQIRLSYSIVSAPELPDAVISEGHVLAGKNPRFTDVPAMDYRLASNSFAVNSGDPDTLNTTLTKTDLKGEARIANGRVDLGPYEYHGDFLRLTRPNGGESFKQQTMQTVRWKGNVTPVQIEYSADLGNNWEFIATITNDEQSYDWQVPNVFSEQCLIRITAADQPEITDQSDTSFIIGDRTVIRDGAYVSGLWSKEMSPVEIRGVCIVPKDSLLRIEPGVKIFLAAGSEFNFQSPDFDAGLLHVKGHLIAEGTESDSVIFTAEKETGYWGTIFFDRVDSSLSRLSFVKIERARGVDSLKGDNYPAALSLIDVSPLITHCRISDNPNHGIMLNENSNPRISQSRIDHNGSDGIYAAQQSRFPKPEIDHNRIYSNGRHGINLQGIISAYVHDNLIENNDSTAVYLATGYAVPLIENNRLGYAPVGIYCENAQPDLVGNVMYHLQTGWLLRESDPTTSNNTFADNQKAVYCENSNPIFSNTLFGKNDRDFDFASGDNSAPVISYSMTDKFLFSSKITDAGYNRTNANPGFGGKKNHPYALNGTSAAIDRGTTKNLLVDLPEYDVAGRPRVMDGNNDGEDQIDMGAYEFFELSAAFSASPLSGALPLKVKFTDQSKGEIDNWYWDFGDSATSSQKNPQHTYTTPGRFTVRLIVEGIAGRDTSVKADYIFAKYPPYVCRSVQDTTFREDSGWHFIRSLDSVFCQQDTTADLSYSVKSDL